MNKLMTAIIASTFIYLSFFSPVWADGWGNTNWGMNIPQVEEAIKGKLMSHRQDIPPKGYSHQLQDNISIGTYKFEVYFNFEGGKLDKVTLKLTSPDPFKAYLYLVDELQKKYGSPLDGPKQKKESFGSMYNITWITKDTIICLVTFFYIYDKEGKFEGTKSEGTEVSYFARQSAASGRWEKPWSSVKGAAAQSCAKTFEEFQLQVICMENEKKGYDKMQGDFGMPSAVARKAKERCESTFQEFQLQAICMENEKKGYDKMKSY